MSQPSGGVPPFRIVYSGRCLADAAQLLVHAKANGRFAEVAMAIREIDTRLAWIPLDFGEPLQDFVHLAIKEHIGVWAPLVVK